MKIREIKDKNTWENFLLDCEQKTFLDSWNWGEFQEKMGNKIWRLGIYSNKQQTTNNKQLLSVVLVIKIQAKRGTFLLIQHGPMITQNSKLPSSLKLRRASKTQSYKSKLKIDVLKILLGKLKEIAENEKASFIRIAPLLERNEENKKIFKDLGFRESPMHANAYEATWKLDIAPSEEELLKNMRKTTRYLIRQAIKNPDITIEKSKKLGDIEIYQKLNKEVTKRQNFIPFSYEYIRNEFEIFSKDDQCLWLFGKYKNELTAAALIIFWSGIGFYHQAASLKKYAKFSIPYLILWEAIKEAKKRGCVLYDFWGYVDPKKEPKHPWTGPTLFKMGFGGRPYEYVKTQDFIISQKYWLNFLVEKLRTFRRFGFGRTLFPRFTRK